MTTAASQRRRGGRSPCPPPPPLTRGRQETFLGSVLLEEFEGATAVVLVQLLRGAMLWAQTPAPERERLFLPPRDDEPAITAEAIGLDASLTEPLGTLCRVLDAPTTVAADEVVSACRQLADWADEQGKLATALAFMQAAALAAPENAHLAYLTGRLARRRAEYARAESWFDYGAAVARRNADWASYARVFIGLGNLYLQRGNFPAARRSHTRALRIARKHGLRELEAMAAHDLFVITHESYQLREAQAYATEALQAYGAGHPRLPSLANDVACLWMNAGQFARALPVLQAVLPHLEQRRERLLTLGNLARASGALGDAEVFRDAWGQVWETLAVETDGDGAAQALLDLAHGAASLSEWEQAERAATRALEIAVQRREAQVQLAAESVLQRVRNRQAVRPPLHSYSAREKRQADGLAHDLVASLEAATAAPA